MELCIGTFNILNTCSNYPARKPFISKTIQGMNCDIIGIQEVNFEGNLEILNFPDYNFEFIRMPNPIFLPIPDFRIDGNALLIKKDISIIERHELVYSIAGRVAQIVKLRKNQTEFLVINTHLDYLSDGNREAQIKELFEFIRNFGDLPIVWTGDLNLTPTSVPYSLISQNFRSANVESHGKEPEKTYPTALEWTYDTALIPICLDYIWLKGKVNSLFCEVYDQCGSGKVWASDHFPLRALIKIHDN